jgi:hypothetical protein
MNLIMHPTIFNAPSPFFCSLHNNSCAADIVEKEKRGSVVYSRYGRRQYLHDLKNKFCTGITRSVLVSGCLLCTPTEVETLSKIKTETLQYITLPKT